MSIDSKYSLRKFLIPEFIFGVDALSMAGQYATNYGARKVLIVTDPGVIEAGWTERVIESLNEYNITYQVYDNVSPNPKDSEVMEGAELYKSTRCNVIIAVGGGSPMDCAKGIGIVSSNKKNILLFEGVDEVDLPIPPLICIPTTGGTSADVSQFCIINNVSERVKIAIISKAVVPDVALIDPRTLTTMDSYLTACTGVDALVHAIEAFVSNANSQYTDMHAIKAIEIISKNLSQSILEPKNLDYRAEIMFGSLQAGIAFSNASLGIVHAMAHSLGGFLDLPHGECNALLLNHVMNFNYDSSPERFSKICELMGIPIKGLNGKEIREKIVTEIAKFRDHVGIKNALGSRGVKSSDISALAKKAMNDACIVTNPRMPNARDIEVIYEEAL